jgi:epoxyqueuosine reductase
MATFYSLDMSIAFSNQELIRMLAKERGFDEVRFASVEPSAGIENYDRFLAEGRQGEMSWMETSREPRANPKSLLPSARSIVVLGMHYAHHRPADPGGLTGKVACYAWGRDYHNLIGKRLRKLSADLRDAIPGFESYAGVDSRPIIERAWAQRAGLGFLGKNALAILPGQSSYFFLAAMLVNIDLPATPALGDHCGTCRRCLDVCPTQAFTAPGELDARRCISYLTIEHKGNISDPMKGQLGRWVFGCDDCQEVCPHNPADPPAADDDFAPRKGHAWLDLEWVLHSEDEALNEHFIGSPIRRARPQGLKRNAAIVLGNLGDSAARPALLHSLQHPAEMVRDASRWALDQL